MPSTPGVLPSRVVRVSLTVRLPANISVPSAESVAWTLGGTANQPGRTLSYQADWTCGVYDNILVDERCAAVTTTTTTTTVTLDSQQSQKLIILILGVQQLLRDILHVFAVLVQSP
jgi:hypothetical protein